MRAEEFVAFLQQRPYGESIAPGVAGGAIRRSVPHSPVSNDELCRLVSLFDCSSLEIGFVTFFSDPPYYRGEALVVARFEADYLGIHRETGHVLWLDHAVPYFVMLEVAQSGARFLDALALLLTPGDRIGLPDACAAVAGAPGAGGFYEQLV